jgi:MbtH protein
MTGPFDDPDALYLLLVTPAGAACLWPAWAGVPAGWDIAHGPRDRDACLAHLGAESCVAGPHGV